MFRSSSIACVILSFLCGCSADDDSGDSRTGRPDAGTETSRDAATQAVTFRDDVEPVRRAEDALEHVFIPPFVDCRAPLDGEPDGDGPDGHVCTNVAISGCTEPGRYFPDYAECDVVRTQRPFWPEPPAAEPSADDPRLDDPAFMTELDWVTEQVRATACTCCHDSTQVGGQAGQWDIALGPIWLDTLSDTGLALFTGLADSASLGAYPAEDNHGFDRTKTGIPTTDTKRMRAFLLAELDRRGITEEEARAVKPFGGPIYANSIAVPGECKAGEGVDPEGRVHWNGGAARYVYVAEAGSKNPGVPPNNDLPEGTLWRLDVLASEEGVSSELAYGTTPRGSFQAFPETERAPQLKRGEPYLLTVLRDVGLPLASCVFTFGEEVEPKND